MRLAELQKAESRGKMDLNFPAKMSGVVILFKRRAEWDMRSIRKQKTLPLVPRKAANYLAETLNSKVSETPLILLRNGRRKW